MENPKCPYCGGEMEYYWDNNPMMPYGFYYCVTCGCHAPSASTQAIARAAAMKRERANGKWILVHKGLLSTTYRCSHCGNYFEEHSNTLNAGRGDKKYCPNCGADMREEANDEP